METKPCRRRSVYKMQRTIERQLTMPEDKGFKCDICNKSFNARIALAGHMRSHSKGAINDFIRA